MSNPISILLIIGSAVVGPIQAQPTACNEVRPQNGALQQWKCETDETLVQLCERAMREIGAVPDQNHPHDKYLVSHGKDDALVALPVRCIPVPEGYRK